jgi:hypothetical protein
LRSERLETTVTDLVRSRVVSDIFDGVLFEPPANGDEADTLVGSLERQRRTFAWKCGGLDADGTRATTAASTLTLGGLLKHLALIETYYFSFKLWGRPIAAPFDAVDFDADPEWEFRTAADDSPDELMKLWEDNVVRSRELLAEALADGGLDFTWRSPWADGVAPSLRRMLVDLIEEYARHTGQADLIRESVDGLVGEDPPR